MRNFFGAKLIGLKKPDRGLRPIAVGKTFRRLSAKCAGYYVFESRQATYGNRQVGVGTKKGAELASHISHLGNFFKSYSLDLSCGPQPPYSVNNSPVKWVRVNLSKGNLPKPNFSNVKDKLPNFVSANCPFEFADFCRKICRIPSVFK